MGQIMIGFVKEIEKTSYIDISFQTLLTDKSYLLLTDKSYLLLTDKSYLLLTDKSYMLLTD